MKEITLERMDFAAKQEIPPALLDSIKIEQLENMVTGRLVFMLRAAIYGQRLDEQVVRYPADWWQAFKARFFPRWALRRWPVLETVKTMRLYAWYPDKFIPDTRSQFLVRVESGEPPSP